MKELHCHVYKIARYLGNCQIQHGVAWQTGVRYVVV